MRSRWSVVRALSMLLRKRSSLEDLPTTSLWMLSPNIASTTFYFNMLYDVVSTARPSGSRFWVLQGRGVRGKRGVAWCCPRFEVHSRLLVKRLMLSSFDSRLASSGVNKICADAGRAKSRNMGGGGVT